MPIEPPDKVARKISALPNSPGVYLWKDREGRVLYVGKANRLRARTRQYFASDHDDHPKHDDHESH